MSIKELKINIQITLIKLDIKVDLDKFLREYQNELNKVTIKVIETKSND